MRGRKGFFSLFTSLPEHQENKSNDVIRRRRRHSSGDRETWSRKVEYFFAGLGYAVGLGNIWRFPYLCYRNGGGAFLVPYFIILIVVGFPMLLLEMGIGQFASLGPVTIWRISPLFKGIGYAIVMILLLMNTYYNVLIAYALFYMFASITNELPWARCNNLWNTANCIESRYDGPSNKSGAMDTSNVIGPAYSHENVSGHLRHLLKTPTEEFFENHLLHMSSGIGQVGSLQWPLIVCLGVSWFTCFMCLYKGIKSMGKAVIFTTVFSYAILAVLLIRGVTLKGSAEGIIYYLKPDFRKLANLQVWGEASAQALASLSLGGGGWITLSSYNKFKNRCDRDAWLVGLGNALTSLFAGFVIFSVLGHMAYKKDVPVENVTASGPGLAFVAYPEGLALIPFAPFWAVCFFFMMFTVGLDSLFGQVESIASGIIDEYPDYLRPRRKMFTLFLCTLMFFMGMPLVTEGGMYMVTLIDWYILLFSFTIVCLSEIIAIIYVYGYEKFAHDMEMMLGKKPSMYYMVSWRAITPISLVIVIILLAGCYVPPYYGSYTFPTYAKAIGWILAFGPVSLIPLTILWQFCRRVGSVQTLKDMVIDADTRKEVRMRMTNPTMDWGPALPENFRKYSVDRNLHPNIANVELGEDDVFGGGTEMSDIQHANPDEKVHLVHFKDKVDVEGEQGQSNVAEKEQGQGDASTKEQGQGDAAEKEQGQGDAAEKEQGQGDATTKEQGQGDAKSEGEGEGEVKDSRKQ